MAYNQNLKIDSMMEIYYSARLFGIVFSDMRLKILERHTYAYVITQPNQQTMAHLLSCRLLDEACTADDLATVTERAMACDRIWKNIV